MGGVAGKDTFASEMIRALTHRGPDDSGVASFGDATLVHTRLAIQDLDPRSRCPFTYGNVVLVYSGELWAGAAITAELGIEMSTTGDTEIVAAALDRWGVDALPRLEGMFAMAWYDHRDGKIRLARDRFGEIPLHLAPVGDRYDADGAEIADGFAFASELKALRTAASLTDARWVEPGSCAELERLPTGRWRARTTRYYDAPTAPAKIGREEAGETMRSLVERAVRERTVSDVPVCTLLSGGIDSTAVAYHLVKEIPNLVAYTAVYDEKSHDLRMARLAAETIGIELREVKVPLPTERDLAGVIGRIEMSYKAQVEIGWPCLWLARQMQEDGFKVCFSGEGADELFASYGFAFHAMQRDGFDWHGYRKDLFIGQHAKNFPRVNKIFMSHGVEGRLPFLHTPLVEFALSLPAAVCFDKRSTEKQVLKAAYRGILPDRIVERAKVAFQVGMGIRDAIEIPTKAFYGDTYKEAFA